MEELRSSDALDREILEEARKKADKALRDADREIEAIERTKEEERAVLAKAMRDEREAEFARIQAELAARVPLEAIRARAAASAVAIEESARAFLEGLPDQSLLPVLMRRFEAAVEEFAQGGATLRCEGFEKGAVEAALPGAIRSRVSRIEEAPGTRIKRRIVVESNDGRTSFTCGAESLLDELLSAGRAGLASLLREADDARR